jgi:two-component system nitrate/nitrite response regulator NarL
MSSIRILLVDDQLLFRKGLRALLDDQEDMEVVGEAADGLQALDRARAAAPDVVLMDIHMPVCNGVEATRKIKLELPETKVVALTVSDEDDDLFEAIKSGAEGYLLKDLRPEELYDLLRGVMKGETPISPAVASKLLSEFRTRPRRDLPETPGWDLTARELEVLQLVTSGLSNAEIAARLHIVEGTVKNHLHNILEKLHLENRVQAAAYAIREGLVEPPSKERPIP